MNDQRPITHAYDFDYGEVLQPDDYDPARIYPEHIAIACFFMGAIIVGGCALWSVL